MNTEIFNSLSRNKVLKKYDLIKNLPEKERFEKNKLISIFDKCNLPFEYWSFTEKNLDEINIEIYNNLLNNIDEIYNNGTSYIFQGKHGVGKTLTASLLVKKAAAVKNYECLFTNLEICVSQLTNFENKSIALKTLYEIDFLVIDEVDNRHFISSNFSELAYKMLENIIRQRGTNCVPTIIITNSSTFVNNISDNFKQAISSLLKRYEQINFGMKDHRSLKLNEK
jgi:DNA replication protein DnaC